MSLTGRFSPSTCVSCTVPEIPSETTPPQTLVSTKAHPPALVFLRFFFYSTPRLVSLLVGPNTTNLKTKTFFMLCIRCVCSEHPAAGRSESYSLLLTLKAVWVIGLKTLVSGPHLLMKLTFIWLALSTLFRFYTLDIVYDRSQKR